MVLPEDSARAWKLSTKENMPCGHTKLFLMGYYYYYYYYYYIIIIIIETV